jgi:hypothetical protein
VSPVKSALFDVERALQRDEITAEHAGKLIGALGAEGRAGTLADVGGENVRGLMERVSQTPGAGRTVATPFLETRQVQQASRIADDLSELAGTKKSAFEAVTQTMAQRASEGKPLYQKAMDYNARADADIVAAWEEATSTGWGKSILNSGTLKRNIQSEYGIKDISQAPLMVLIDSWGKAAGDMVGAAVRAGRKNEVRVISEARDSVLDVVKQKNPAYVQAQSAWAGSSRYLDAVEQGQNILGKKLSAEQLTADFAKLGDSEKEAFRIGAVSSIVAKMRGDPAKLADMTKYLRSPEVREKVAAIMPNKAAADSWNRRLNFEVGSSELVGQSLRGSATARRQAEMQQAKSITGDLVMHYFSGGGSVGAISKLLMGFGTSVRDTVRSRTDKQIARILTRPMAQQPTGQMLPPLPPQ